MKILVMDGQGGKIGRLIVEQIKQKDQSIELIAIGTNSIATAAMMKAGADYGATGENAVLVNCRDADIIIGPIGIILSDALLGEVTPAMASAVSSCKALKIIIPISKCNTIVTGTKDLSLNEYIQLAVQALMDEIKNSGLN